MTQKMSPLRRRMIEDMTVRNLSPATQRSYISAVLKFSRYFGRSPDQLELEDVRAFQVHLVSTGISWPGLNQIVCALRFFYGVTLGQALTYLEGWYAIAEANRIFGFDGWNRETVESKCVLTHENRGTFLAVYIARVRVTVHADGATIIREGHGTSEGRGTSPGEVHDIALKAAETDATKRALATFGKPFGLELYRGGRTVASQKPLPLQTAVPEPPVPAPADAPLGFHPDYTTPIPRPSRYFGRCQDLVTRDRAQGRRVLVVRPSAGTSIIVPVSPGLVPVQIDKSVLTIAEPKRLRDKAHLRFVASQPCLVCGRQPSDPHHLRFAQPRALGIKVSDEFTVPLCRGHHRQLHQAGNEVNWWENLKIDALPIAKALWEQTRPKSTAVDTLPHEDTSKVTKES